MSQHLLSTDQVCTAYAELRTRVSALAQSLTADQAQTIVPHCPQWTVKDCLAHMVGVPEDLISGQMDGVASEAWTNRQVQRHAQDSVQDLLTIWENNAAVFATILPNIQQPVISQFAFDQATHEHDIRTALQQPGARDSLAVSVAEGFLRNLLAQNADPAVAQLATHELSGFEFVRALSGRRSRTQIAQIGFDIETVESFVKGLPFDIPEFDVSD